MSKIPRIFSVRVTSRPLSFWNTVYEKNKPRPSELRCKRSGLVVARGGGQEDDSLWQGKDKLHISWKNIKRVRFNKWFNKEIKVELNEGVNSLDQIYIIWFGGFYKLERTEDIYRVIKQLHDRHKNL